MKFPRICVGVCGDIPQVGGGDKISHNIAQLQFDIVDFDSFGFKNSSYSLYCKQIESQHGAYANNSEQIKWAYDLFNLLSSSFDS